MINNKTYIFILLTLLGGLNSADSPNCSTFFCCDSGVVEQSAETVQGTVPEWRLVTVYNGITGDIIYRENLPADTRFNQLHLPPTPRGTEYVLMSGQNILTMELVGSYGSDQVNVQALVQPSLPKLITMASQYLLGTLNYYTTRVQDPELLATFEAIIAAVENGSMGLIQGHSTPGHHNTGLQTFRLIVKNQENKPQYWLKFDTHQRGVETWQAISVYYETAPGKSAVALYIVQYSDGTVHLWNGDATPPIGIYNVSSHLVDLNSEYSLITQDPAL